MLLPILVADKGVEATMPAYSCSSASKPPKALVFALVAASMLGFGVLGLRRQRAHGESRRPGEPSMNPDSPIPDECDMRQIVPIRPIVVSVSNAAQTSSMKTFMAVASGVRT